MRNEFVQRIISSILIAPLSFFVILKGSILFNFFIISCFIISFYEWNLMVQKINHKILGVIFLIFSFFAFYDLRNSENDESVIYIFYVIIICIFTDIGGYTFGKFLKGPKITKLSPKKTYSGVLGSYFLAFLFSLIFFEVDYFFNKINLEITIDINYFFIFFISSVSQLGDLFISYFKRTYKIKDTGIILPGHGGLLDRIDGMIFAIPASYIIYIFNYY